MGYSCKYRDYFKGELCFGCRWAPKLTKGPYNSSNRAQSMKIELKDIILQYFQKYPLLILRKKINIFEKYFYVI